MLMILLAHAELKGLICSGGVIDGEHTYALMSKRVPTPRRLGRIEALAELALRYFTGHGPATEQDLAYWATAYPLTCASAFSRCVIGSTRSSTTGAPSGTPR